MSIGQFKDAHSFNDSAIDRVRCRWDFGTSVEEVMRGLHTWVMSGKVLYLGASDMPAWVVVKANACECPLLLLYSPYYRN